MSGTGALRGSLWNRSRQFMRAFRCPGAGEADRYLRQHVDNPEQYRLLVRLPAYDRAHHARVHRFLIVEGFRDQDLLLAALLHDVGKADDIGRVRLVHRVGRVLARRFAPKAYTAFATWSEGRAGFHGFFLAEFHAEIGSVLAREAGASDVCCTLIASHESPEPADTLLRALIEADERVS